MEQRNPSVSLEEEEEGWEGEEKKRLGIRFLKSEALISYKIGSLILLDAVVTIYIHRELGITGHHYWLIWPFYIYILHGGVGEAAIDSKYVKEAVELVVITKKATSMDMGEAMGL